MHASVALAVDKYCVSRAGDTVSGSRDGKDECLSYVERGGDGVHLETGDVCGLEAVSLIHVMRSSENGQNCKTKSHL